MSANFFRLDSRLFDEGGELYIKLRGEKKTA